MRPEDSFFAQFDAATVPHIAEFAKRLTNLRADVYVLMARKAACFVEALSRLRLTTLNGVITTDRILDMDRTWLKGKSVAIIDEALISGTTLHRTEEILLEAGVAKCETHVFCVNSRWWSKELAQPVKPYLLLDDKRTTAFCADIVDAISVLPLPYSVDFPHLSNVRVPYVDLHHLWGGINWTAHDVTSSLQRYNNVVSITLIPGESVARDLDRDLGWPVSLHSQLLKIRTYARHDAERKDRDVWWFQFVPMVVLDPLTESEVDALWECILARLNSDSSELRTSFTTHTSRLRLIQYVLAMRLWRRYIKALALELGSLQAAAPSLQSIRNVFSPQVADAVARACGMAGRVFSAAPIRSSGYCEEPPAVGQTDRESLSVAQRRLTEPFLRMYYEREIPARELVLAHGKSVFSMPEFEDTMSRLRTGFPLPYLRSLLCNLVDQEDQATVVSLFLDHAVDHGIIVPVTRDEKGILYRGYRHGEDVLWGQNEERLAYLLIEAYLQASGREHVPRIWLEKLLVLLIRIGVQRTFLRRYHRTLGDDGTVGIRYALKGAVVRAHAPRLYGAEADGALSGLLLESGTLVQDGSGQYRLGVAPPKEAPTKDNADANAVIIGSVFGSLHLSTQSEADPNLRLTDQELIILATCPQPNDAAAAIAAEIALFVDAWRYRTAAMKSDRLPEGQAMQLLTYLSRPAITEALTSAVWKYRSFLDGVAWKLIDRIGLALRDPVYRQTWQGFWSPSGSQPDAVPAPVQELLDREGKWLVRANVMFRSLELALSQEGHPPALDSDAEARICRIEELLSHASAEDQRRLNVSALRERLHDRSFRAEKLRRFTALALDQLAYEGRALLDIVDSAVAPIGQIVNIVTFRHAMFVSASPLRSLYERHWEVFEGAVHAARSVANRNRDDSGRSRIEMLPAGGQPGFEHGRWVCASGPFARARLIRLAAEIHKRLSSHCEVRTYIFAHMLPEETLLLRDFSTHFLGFNFWSRVVSIFNRQDAPTLLRHSLVTITPVLASEAVAVRREVLEDKESFKYVKGFTVTDETPVKSDFKIDQFSAANTRPKRTARQVVTGLDIGIVTIVAEEMRAVKDTLARTATCTRKHGRRSNHIFYQGELPSANGIHRVVATQALGQGNRSVIMAYNVLRSEASPLLIVLLGIAGGIHQSLRLGDVAIADRVFYYGEGKEKHSGFSHRLSPDRPPAWIIPELNDFFVEYGDPAKLPTRVAASDRPGEFEVHLGPIGTGDAVIGYRDAPVLNYLREVNDKTLAVETEAGGVARAFYEEQLEFDARTKGYLIIRGISDHADQEKDDRYRSLASENATIALEKIVGRIPTLSTWSSLERL